MIKIHYLLLKVKTIFQRHNSLIITLTTILSLLIAWYILILPQPLFSTPYSTVLYARNGELLGAKVATDGQWRLPSKHTLPEKYISAVIEYEDRRFYSHNGVSIHAIARATRQNYRADRVVSGGSTLTMQLSRMHRSNPPRTILNKLWEMVLATRIEWSYTKEEVLAIYAAHAPFGGNVVGLEAAAWRYFGHDPANISWAEAATLAVLPNSPALIHPGRGRETLLAKRNNLLHRLLITDKIDSIEYSIAIVESLPNRPKPLPRHAPHLFDNLADGIAVHSSLDYTLQQRAQQIVDNYGSSTLKANKINNAAVLVADIQTGETLAYIGNITPSSSDKEMNDGRSVDIITSRRSTGSIIKPILYGALLSEGQLLPNTLILDTPLSISGFTPTNYNKTFNGVVSARSAIERSLNVPIVRMLTLYNSNRFLHLLRSMGITTLDRSADNYGATLILGGAESTLWEMGSIYASLARSLQTYNAKGHYSTTDMLPLTITPSTDNSLLPSNLDKPSNICPLSPSSIWFMLEAMSGVNRPEEEASWQEFSTMKQVAWKTGTSYGNRDAWAIGVTPRYLVGVWVGNADGEGRASMTGVGTAAPVMFDVFSMLPSADSWFEKPLSDVEMMAVCQRSGHRASHWCYSSGDHVDTLAMPKVGIATPLCHYHKPVTADGVTKGWFILPPTAEYYYKRATSDYISPPSIAGVRPLELIYPQHNTVLYLPQGFGSKRLVFRAAHRSDDAAVHWHLNNDYIKTTYTKSTVGHTISINPEPGVHWLTIVDNAGESQKVRFTVLDTDNK